MKIVHVITGLSVGGAEMMLLKLLQKLDSNLFECTVISLLDKQLIGERIELLGIPVYSLGITQGGISLSGLLKLCKLLQEIKPDLIQGWMYHGNLAASLSNYGCPVIWNIRHSLYDINKEPLLTRLVIFIGAMLSRHTKFIVYNSERSAKQHQNFGYFANKSKIIANGFDLDNFKPSKQAYVEVRRELGLNDDALLIGLIARYHPMKDHTNFLQAAALLNKKFPTVHFLMAGYQVDMQNCELTSVMKQLSLENTVHLLGPRNDIARLNAALNIASSSSWAEAFPNVLGEAMACEIPCVATDVGDSGYLIGETGLVVPPRSPVHLAQAWHKILEMSIDKRIQLGMSARKRITDLFSIDTIAIEYARLYESAAKEIN